MAELLTADGTKSGTVKLDNGVFGIQPNIPVLHQVITAQLAAKRSGTQSTKSRSDVRGGGAKPWRQKGTGKARAGSSRSPIWQGGGVAHAPKPRSYEQKTPKKMIRLALYSALSDRNNDKKVIAVDSWTSWGEPKTKLAINFLEKAGIEGKVLVVLDEGTQDDFNAYLSFRNLEKAHVLVSAELNAYDVLNADWIVFSKSCLPTAQTAGSDPVKHFTGSDPVASEVAE
jgi:large subunit ribosomal protein L4